MFKSMRCSILFSLFMLYFEVILCDEFSIVRFESAKKSQRDQDSSIYFCITDRIHDAIVWNTNPIWDEKKNHSSAHEHIFDTNTRLFHRKRVISEDKLCEVDRSTRADECKFRMIASPSDWKSTWNSEVAMGPVFDSRWEKFQQYIVSKTTELSFQPIPSKARYGAFTTFSSTGAVVVSIRGASDAHFLICANQEYRTSLCYWIIIGGHEKTFSQIKRCPNGVSHPLSKDPCESTLATLHNSPLSINEWKTFVITWNGHRRIISLYDPHVCFLTYTDTNEVHHTLNSYHVFYGNPTDEHPIRFRFHEYNYSLTTKADVQIDSHSFRTYPKEDGEICIDMMVGLCPSCELDVRVIDSTTNKELANKIIMDSSGYYGSQHGLPMWQHVRLIVSTINDKQTYAMMNITTKLKKVGGEAYHWAIRDVHKCLPKGTVKQSILRSRKNIKSILGNVTCQRLSYHTQHMEVISPYMDIKRLSESPTFCPNNYVGLKCSVPCHLFTDAYCKDATICNKTLCYCPQGYTSNDCSEKCADGQFGYNCRDKCENCEEKKCNIYSGECLIGCKKLAEGYKYVPPFCKYSVKFPEFHFDQIDRSTLRIYFLKVHVDNTVNSTYAFRLKINDELELTQSVENGIDVDERPIYYSVFEHLNLGDRYSALILQHIKYHEHDRIVQTSLLGDFSEQFTMCCWTGNFTAESDDISLTVHRINFESLHSCPDDYYSVEIQPTSSFGDLQMNDVTNIKGEFPLTIRNLSPDTDYSISIRGLSPFYRHRRQVRTLPAGTEQSSNIGLSINSVSSTEVSFSWLPPTNPDDIIESYGVAIMALNYGGCSNKTSVESANSQSKDLDNTTRSYTFQNLIPYVHYEILISVRHELVTETSSLAFMTNATEIPTAIYQNLTFVNREIKWVKHAPDCTVVTGPIRATRLFFAGISENVKNFTDRYDVEVDSFILNVTKKQDVYDCEQYRVRIHPLRAINGKHNESAYSELTFTNNPLAQNPPREIYVVETNQNGTFYLNWSHPVDIKAPVTQFTIHIELISTNLCRELKIFELNSVILYPIKQYLQFYKAELKLLPSTKYKIDIRSVAECANFIAIGNPSGIITDTPSRFAWHDHEPSYTVNNNNYSITVHLQRYTHETQSSKMYIFLIGEASCGEILNSNNSLARDIVLSDNETIHNISTFSMPPSTITIGGHKNDNIMLSCVLFLNTSYVVVIIVRDEDIDVLNRTKSLIWRSESIIIVSRVRFEIWAAPLLILIIIIIGLSIIIWYCRKRKRNRKRQVLSKRSGSGDIKSKLPQHEMNLSPIPEGRYIQWQAETLVKLDKFQEYVKGAIASGRLEMQFSRLSSSRTKSEEDGLISQHSNDNESAVILRDRSDDPFFKCLNAQYINGYKKPKAYIVLEGPQSAAIINFWRLVWQEQIEVICMLSDIIDSEQIKSEQYWPEKGTSMIFENITVEIINYAPFADYAFRVFQVKCGGETRMVNHLHYTAWPDHGIPLYTQSVVTYLKKLFAIPSSTRPILVHCNAGCGSSGTIILFDICHRRAVAEGVVDILSATEEMKRQRPNLLDNKQQYIFGHVALVECLLSVSTSIPCNAELQMKIREHKNQLPLQQKRLEQSVLHDQAVEFSTRSQLKLSEKNIAKNRLTDSLPLTRLYIPRYPLSDDDSSYIAGVYVDSARRRNSYVATQLPMPKTVNDFWRMIGAFRVELIIILQEPDIEDPTCIRFIPEPDEIIQPVPFLSIKGKTVIDQRYFMQQKIVMFDESTGSLREQPIMVLTCKGWERGGNKVPPSPASLVELWQTAEKISRSDEPTVVLCYDGVTGCGMYLALSLLLERMGLEHECDVCFAIRAIRRSRSNFCKTRVQFGYLHNAALHYAAHFDAYSNFK